MADVFLSYSREDSDAAGRIARQLEAEGLAVFWDKEIPPGVSWADYLQDKLTSARCVIVLWSAASIGSQWVREEARMGRDGGKLLPVFLDTSAPPFGFGEVQSASLISWNGEAEAEDWRRLADAVRAAVSRGGGDPVHRKPAPAASSGVRAPSASVPGGGAGAPARRGALKLVGFGAAGMFGLLLVIGLMQGGAPALAASQTEILSSPDASGPLTSASPLPAPSAGAASAPGAIAPAVQAALDAALADDAAAQKAAAAARAFADQGRSAAAAGQAGTGGFASQMLPDGSMIAGDLMTFMAMQPAIVGVQSPSTGLQFFGRYQQLADGYSMNGVATTGAVSGAGSWRYRIDGYDFTGQGILSGRFTASGVERGGLGGSSSGRGVVTFADGRRYVGEYRTTGQGADIDLVLEGRGALYSPAGAVESVGRFSCNVLVSPN